MKKISLIIFSAFLLSGCLSDGILKKSANNKLFDRDGFHGKKRRPLYNKKYIDKAKLHIARGEFEEDEYDDEERYLENLPPSLKNRYIYEDMIEEDIKEERAKRARKKSKYRRKLHNHDDGYPNIGRGRDRVRDARENGESQDLKRELTEIKTMLDAAREDLVKYRCPVDDNGKPVLAVKHEVKPKKIHEEIKAEEKSKVNASSLQKAPIVSPKAASKPKPKVVSNEVNKATSVPQKAAPKAEPKSVLAVKPAASAPKPVQAAPKAKVAKPVVHKAPEASVKQKAALQNKPVDIQKTEMPKGLEPNIPNPKPEAKADSLAEHSHGDHMHGKDTPHVHSHGDGIPHSHEPEEVISFPTTNSDAIKPVEDTGNMQTTMPDRPEIKELAKPKLTEIPSVIDESEAAPDVPELPSFP